MRVALVALMAVGACRGSGAPTAATAKQPRAAAPEGARPGSLEGPPLVTRGPEMPFFEIPGMTQVAVTSRLEALLWESVSTTLEVRRGEEIVCEIPSETRGSAEGQRSSSGLSLAVTHREPLQLAGRRNSRDALASSTSCVVYDFPVAGRCRMSEPSCRLESTTLALLTPGTGVVFFDVHDHAIPLPGITFVARGGDGPTKSAISDENGAAQLEPLAPGPISVDVFYDDDVPARTMTLRLPPHRDLHIAATSGFGDCCPR